jgi:ubiquinone/menaquinone biosynthesis C-methylase UbiE
MARLNEVEMRSMQSPFRRVLQKHLELPTFAALLDAAGIDLRGKRLLEVGCGSGYGLSLLAERFAPSRLVGFDLMPEQIELARAREVAGATVRVGDVTRIEDADESFDAVFVFGILHHVPEWRDAQRELARVLAPSGVLLIEELDADFVDFEDKFLKTEHPKEARFTWSDFRDGLTDAGFEILGERQLVIRGARSFLAQKS